MGQLKKALFAKNIVEQYENPTEKKTLSCSKHGEYEGFSTINEGGEVRSICPECFQIELDNEREEREREQRKAIAEARIKNTFKRSSFPKLFSKIGFDDYKPCCSQAEETLSRMKLYVEKFENVREVGSSVIFIGGTGTGKTMMAAAIGNSVINKGYTVLYMTCPQTISMIKRSWVKGSDTSQDEYLERMKKPDLLILDEVPKGCSSKHDWELIHEIMNRRYMEQKPTITISTLTEKELRKQMTDEVLRRMHFRGKIMHFNWNSFKDIGLLW